MSTRVTRRAHEEQGRRGLRRPMLALNTILLLLGASALAASPPGDPVPAPQSESSDCIAVTVYFWVLDEDENKQYVLGPDRCVGPTTPWGHETAAGSERAFTGVDSGYGVIVKLPHPPPPA